MASRGRGGGAGGRRGGGDFNRGGGRGQGGGGGRGQGGGGGRGQGGGGGRGVQNSPPTPYPATPVPSQPAPPRPLPMTDLATSSTPSVAKKSVAVSSSPAENVHAEMEKLAIAPQPDTLPTPAPSSAKAAEHPRRPGFGTKGRKCIIKANHFLVVVKDKNLYHYDVAITPEVMSRAVCRSIISELVTMYKNSHLGMLTPAYDGRKSLYTAGELPFTSEKFKINLTSERGIREFDVVIKLAGRADLHHLQRFLEGKQHDAPQDTIQVLDVVLREYPSTNYVSVSRSFFSPMFGNRDDIGEGMECWRGYYQSLRPTQMGLSLNIDISATSFYKPLPVLDFAAQYLDIRSMDKPLSDRDRVKLKKSLRGVRVAVKHSPRRYKITGLSPFPLREEMFPVDEGGEKMYVTQYFFDKYQIELRHLKWPCLQCGSEARPTYLPMELCKIVEGQRFMKKLNEKQVTQILRATCQRPPLREKSISEMVRHNKYNEDKHAMEFGISVSNDMVSVEARVLSPPTLKYHDSGVEKSCIPRVGAWNMIKKKMVNGGTIQSWACISFSRLHPDPVHYFCKSLFGICNTIGMIINPNPVIELMFVRPPANVEAALRNLSGQLKGRPLQMLIVVLPEDNVSYAKIKRVCETELGIVSQCCQPKHVQQCKPQYMENVALKINVKVGGRNTVLEDAIYRRIPLVTDIPTIIFGADVTHPPPGEDTSASIAAVVASMDWPEITKYRCLVSAQSHRDEMIKDLFSVVQDPQKGNMNAGMVRELLLGFFKSTNQKPHRIIFYRDGVSEGQFNYVLANEIIAIRQACASLQDGYQPPITFIVVQKRHHTRLFPNIHGSAETDRSGNILPGTVVDRKICHPTEFDFYLCSHAGIQGTSRPAHYHVLYDENKFTADGLQELTNKLCYTYARCTRSVSIVPPAYYAHLAAFRARYYVEVESDSGSASVATGMREKARVIKPLPKIKDNVKDVMFYC